MNGLPHNLRAPRGPMATPMSREDVISAQIARMMRQLEKPYRGFTSQDLLAAMDRYERAVQEKTA